MIPDLRLHFRAHRRTRAPFERGTLCTCTECSAQRSSRGRTLYQRWCSIEQSLSTLVAAPPIRSSRSHSWRRVEFAAASKPAQCECTRWAVGKHPVRTPRWWASDVVDRSAKGACEEEKTLLTTRRNSPSPYHVKVKLIEWKKAKKVVWSKMK